MSDSDLVARYDGRVPRYTSYPTAPHFSSAIGADGYAADASTAVRRAKDLLARKKATAGI